MYAASRDMKARVPGLPWTTTLMSIGCRPALLAQVLLCIRQGLFDAFRDEHGRRATVYANDCDEDVCLSWFLLQNPELCRLPSNTRLNRLVQAVDVLDTTAGASLYPLDRGLMGELAWIFEPYRQARMQGALGPAARRFAKPGYRCRLEPHSRAPDGQGRYFSLGYSLPADWRRQRLGDGPRNRSPSTRGDD